MAAIFAASSSRAPGGGLAIPDWATHGAAYLVLAVLLGRALAGGRGAFTAQQALLAALLSTAYGVADEYHQSFVPGRDPSAGDVAKDFGSVAGALLYRRRRRGRSGRNGEGLRR